jgi:transcriptional regulator with XRE-family HTH domain
MKKNSLRKERASSQSSAAWFAALVDDMKSSGAYAIEQVKIDIAETIHAEMQRQNITKSELAERLGSSRAYVTKILSGDVNFTVETLAKIGAAMNCESVIHLSFHPMNSIQKERLLPFPASFLTEELSVVTNATIQGEDHDGEEYETFTTAA